MRTYAYVPAKPGFFAGSATNLLALYLSILYVYVTILSRYEEVSRVDTDRVGKMGLILCTFIPYPYRSILSWNGEATSADTDGILFVLTNGFFFIVLYVLFVWMSF